MPGFCEHGNELKFHRIFICFLPLRDPESDYALTCLASTRFLSQSVYCPCWWVCTFPNVVRWI